MSISHLSIKDENKPANLKNKVLIDVLDSDLWVEIGGFDKAKEKFVNDLQVRPSRFLSVLSIKSC